MPRVPHFQTLFNGHDFSGWEHNKNWKIADGAFSCFKIDGPDRSRNALRYTAKMIPGNCEVVFEWKQTGTIDWKKMGFQTDMPTLNPGFRPNYNNHAVFEDTVSGTGIGYLLSSMEIELRTRNLNDKEAKGRASKSGWITMFPNRDYSKPIGQWNRGRILCKGARIQFWLNDNKAYDLDLAAQKTIAAAGHFDDFIQPLEDWIKLKDEGLYLSLIAPSFKQLLAPRVQIRSLRVRELEANERLPSERDAATSKDVLARAGGTNASWKWQDDALFSKLAVSLKDFPNGTVRMAPTSLFEPVEHLTNPGGANDPEVIRNSSEYYFRPTPRVPDMEAMFDAQYREEDSIGIMAWRAATAKAAKSLYDNLASVANDENKAVRFGDQYKVWLVGKYVVLLATGEKTSAACREAFLKHIEKAISRMPQGSTP